MLVTIFALLGVKILAYLAPAAVRPASVEHFFRSVDGRVQAELRNAAFLHDCPRSERKLTIPGGWVCAAPNAPRNALTSIFETYPARASGREYVYASTNAGSMSAARDLLLGKVDIPRYSAYHVGAIPTWSEDPFKAVYWRMNFYGLRPTVNLLHAFLADRRRHLRTTSAGDRQKLLRERAQIEVGLGGRPRRCFPLDGARR